MNFETFNFHPAIIAGIQAAGYETPTPIQNQAIPPILQGRDIIGLAQTGTGKTAAFVLPILQHLLTGQRGKIRAAVISPTRELAEQTSKTFNELGRQTIGSFTQGRWLTWTASGCISVEVRRTGGNNAVLSGVFIDPIP